MSVFRGIQNLFGSRTVKRQPTRRRRFAVPQGLAACESLESRAMLAFTLFPVGGDMLGKPLNFSSDSVGPSHTLTIILEDVTTPGPVTATVTGTGGYDDVYFNFSSISYTASNDTLGDVVNTVSLWTSYDADLTGQEASPSSTASTGLSTNWQVACLALVDLFNVDTLTVNSGVLGGGTSTITGEFESPTLAPTVATGSNITLVSGVGIVDAPLNTSGTIDPVVAYTLSLQSPTGLGGVAFNGDIFTKGDFTITAANDITLGGLIQSDTGLVTLESSSGNISLTTGSLVHAMAGAIVLTAECGAVSLDRLCAAGNITITAPQGVVILTEARSETDEVTMTASAGSIAIKDIFADLDVTATAAQDLSLTGLIESDDGKITLESTSGALAISGSGKVHAIGGDIDLYAKAGTARVQDLVALGTISLFAIGDVSFTSLIETTGLAGDIEITTRGNINNAARVSAGGSITLAAALSVASLGGEITDLEILSYGTNYEYAIVNISPPASGGGRAATGRATITGGRITALTIVDPGYGYASGEVVKVEIIGQPGRTEGLRIFPAGVGATAVATAGLTTSSLTAAQDIGITAGSFIDITNAIHATAGGVTMTTATGRLDISDVFSGKNVSLTASQSIDLSGLIRSEAGSIAVDSKGGSLTITGTTLAPSGSVSLTATGQIFQRGGSVSRQGLFLLSGGRDYTYALVVVSPPPGAGQTALARAVITYYDILDLTQGGYISEIVLLDGGWGYPSDSRVTVSIQGDGEGAEAVFATSIVVSSIEAKDNVTLQGGDTITLLNAVRSAAGDVSIQTTLGDIGVQSIKAGGKIDVESDHGAVTLVSVAAGTDVALTAHQGITVTNSVNSIAGDITIQTTNGDLGFVNELNFENNYLVDNTAIALVPQAVIAAKVGAVTMTSWNGSIVTPYVIQAAKDVDLTSFTSLILTNEITSTSGDITATSTSGRISLAANINAVAGAITLDAHTSLIQEILSGVTKIELLSPGPMVSEPPDVTVTVAPPRQGGDAAVAVAIIERRQLPNNGAGAGTGNNNVIEYEYFIGSIVVLSPGRGYAVGEQPLVTITGVIGAVARAFGPTSMQMVTAGNDIVLAAGENVELATKIHSIAGDVSITSKTGDMDLSVDTLLVSSKAGSIDVTADRGSVTLQRLAGFDAVSVNALQGIEVLGSVYSENSTITLTAFNGAIDAHQLNANNNVTITSFQTSTLTGEIASKVGSIAATSTAGGLFVDANLVAQAGQITLDAETFVEQRHGTGILEIVVLSQGRIQGTIPTVTVTVALPSGGGAAATAVAIIGERSLRDNTNAQILEYFIESILITNGGRGYAVGENPLVTIVGMPGAILRAIGPNNLRNLTAVGVQIAAHDNVMLINTVTALNDDVSITSTSGNIDLSADTLLVQALAGKVILTAECGEITIQRICAEDDVTVTGEQGVIVENEIESETGSIVLVSKAGLAKVQQLTAGTDVTVTTLADLTVSKLITAGGKIDLTSQKGMASIQQLSAVDDLTIAVQQGLVALNSINSTTGDIVITTTNKDLDFRATNAVIGAAAGDVKLTSENGAIYSSLTHASKDIVMASLGTLVLSRQMTSDTGTITITSTSGAITLAGNIIARDEAILLTAKLGVTQLAQGTGCTNEMFTVLAGGTGYQDANTTVTIAAPVGGGTAATARAVIVDGAITGIEIITSGSGYAVDEQPIVTITAVPNAVVPPALVATTGSGAVVSCIVRGSVERNLIAYTDIDIIAGSDVTLLNTVRSDTGDITVKTTDGNLELSAPTLLLSALGGKIDLTSTRGSAKLQHISASGNLTIAVQQGLLALNSINSTSGDVTITTVNRNLDFTPAAALIGCEAGSVTLTSTNGAILSPPVLHVGTNVTISSFATVNLSNDITADFGKVEVTSTYGSIKLGGDIFASVDSISLSAKGEITQVGRGIIGCEVLFGGSGYTAGLEGVFIGRPSGGGVAATARLVVGTVNGISGRVIGIQILTAGSGYAVNEVVDVVIAAPGGLGGTQALASGKAGDATQNLIANEDVTIKSGFSLNLLGWIRGENGDVSIESSRAVSLGAEIFAGDAISIKANSGITQPAGFVKAHSLTLKNSTNEAVTVASRDNNVEQFAAQTLGALTYFDFDDFETGGVLPRTGTPAVEIMASALSLSSGDVGSKIRVVSGLRYTTLYIAAGMIGGSSVGTVEFVTTSELDNPPVLRSERPAFAGTLRDMIHYSNDNAATYLLNGNRLPQPTIIVFDEANYLVEEITVSPIVALPAFTKPVTFAGDQLELTATTDRLGIMGNNSILAGLSLGLGSQGSLIRDTAVYGFTNGTGIVIASGNNVILNTYAGIKADGTSAANSVGLELTGIAAKANLIGSNIFEDTTANRFQANRDAGILIRAGAANNRIFGNIVNSNGDGIRLNAAGGGNQIGTPFEVGPDLMPAVSNEIIGNKLSGIAFINTNATSTAKNTVTNNKIDSNATGITMSASSFAAIGGPASKAANIITRQAKSGIALTGSRDVEIIGNSIGVDAEATTTANRNLSDGIAILSSQRVAITGGNRISANAGNGISIGTGSTAVMIAGNTIGGLLEDGSASGNGLNGVAINASIGNSVGAGNVISNNQNGVSVTDARGTAATGNTIVGSEITSNTLHGVSIVGGSGTTVGGTTAGTRNIITANTTDGIYLGSSLKTGDATNHRIQGNFIGTNENRDVDSSLGNKANGIKIVKGTSNTVSGNVIMNNGNDGIVIDGGNNNTIGGALPSAGNTIAKNNNGIAITSVTQAATLHRIFGNTITKNKAAGVSVVGARVSQITIGQDITGKVVAGRGNTIIAKGKAAVMVKDAQQVAMSGNTTSGTLPMFLDNANKVSAKLAEIKLTSAIFRQPSNGGGQQVIVTGTVTGGVAGQMYSIDIYANPKDPAGGTQLTGIRRFLGRATATADAAGQSVFTLSISSNCQMKELITANATTMRHGIGSTSMHCQPIPIEY